MADGFLGHPFRHLFWSPTLLGVPYYQSALADWFETPTVHILKINVPGSAGGLGCSPSWKDELRLLIERGRPPLYFNCRVMGVGLIRSIRCQLLAEKKPLEHDSLEGCHKDGIKIQLEEGNVLQVSGKAAKPDAPENAVWHVNERSGGEFSREFVLPDNAKVDQIKAHFENGVLTVTVPKETVTKPKTRSISISSKL